jgi:hypothetical protein
MSLLDLNHSPANFLTDKYHAVNSETLLNAFKGAGFNISSQGKANLRIPSKPIGIGSLSELAQLELIAKYETRVTRYNARLGHERHFLRLQSHELKTKAKGHDLFLRVTNSYDGSSSLRVSLDILRLVCLNGMVAPRSIFEIAISHRSKNIYQDAIEASYKILAKKELIDAQIDAMQSKILNTDDKIQLVDKMFEFRYGIENKLELSPKHKLELLKPKRIEEQNDNLYQNFNTLQEKFTKGGRIFLLDASGSEIIRTVREVKSQITSDTFNDNSWQFAATMAA